MRVVSPANPHKSTRSSIGSATAHGFCAPPQGSVTTSTGTGDDDDGAEGEADAEGVAEGVAEGSSDTGDGSEEGGAEEDGDDDGDGSVSLDQADDGTSSTNRAQNTRDAHAVSPARDTGGPPSSGRACAGRPTA